MYGRRREAIFTRLGSPKIRRATSLKHFCFVRSVERVAVTAILSFTLEGVCLCQSGEGALAGKPSAPISTKDLGARFDFSHDGPQKRFVGVPDILVAVS